MTAPLRPAATVLLLRDAPDGLEVWLMERSRAVGFMASAWVFPGGRVDDADADLPAFGVLAGLDVPMARAFGVAALRELEEEASVRIGGAAGYDLGALRTWSHWITPEVEPRRYDTWFFAAALPEGADARADGQEAAQGGWFRPADAAAQAMAGALPVAPPTLRTLMELAAHRTVAEALAAVRRTPPICPRFAKDAEGNLNVLLPGDPDHPSTEAVDPPFRYAFAAGRWWAR
jgi:8-oxo-dGTP pyrophosphatase MutT (NUDIX family)